MKPVPYTGQKLDTGTAVLRFTASWCGPCRVYAPVFDKVMAERPEAAYVVDTEQMEMTAKFHHVMSLPTTILLVDGDEVARLTGLATGARLTEWLNDNTPEREA